MRCAHPPPQHLAYLPCLSLDRQGNIPANWPDPPITFPPRTASYSRSTAARRAPSSGKGHSLGHMKGSGNLRGLGSRLSPGHRLPSQGPPYCPGWACNHCPNPGQGTADMVLLEQEARDGVCLVLLHCGSHHSTPSVNQPPLWVCVSLAPRPELRTYKETMHLLPEPSLILFAQGSFGFLVNVLVLPARLARGGLTQPHASGQRADVLHPSACLATCLCS